MPAPRPILKLSEPDPTYVAASALPFTESRGFDTPHVHFPPTPIMTSTATTHSASIYDRAPIVVSQNVCELPERGERSFIPDLNQGLNPMHHRPPPLVLDHGSDAESPLSSSISHISIRHYSACSVPTSRSVSPTHTLSGSASSFVSCPPSPSMTSDKALSARMVGLSLGITSNTSATSTMTAMTATTLMTTEPRLKSRGKDRSRERERDRDRQDKRERFSGEDGDSWSKDYSEDFSPRTSTNFPVIIA
ncbi:hypothetical protein BJ165DRAFT_1398475 [Panaeolus papilionaceus]|nr:hypothetical protein BJ165DRAFT_1398475 [Panaeolus papilionaceus]